VPNIEKD
jgi:hypothetical protein